MNPRVWTVAGIYLAVLWLVLMMAVAVSAQKRWPTHDRWGNEYPVECQKDLSYMDTFIVLDEDLGRDLIGRKTLGLWWNPAGTKAHVSTIYIDRSVRDRQMQDDILAHERCHEVMWRLYGNPKWHKE